MANRANGFTSGIGKVLKYIGNFFANYVKYFAKGNYKTRLSYVVMGAGCFLNKQVVHGLLYLLAEVVFIFLHAVLGGTLFANAVLFRY